MLAVIIVTVFSVVVASELAPVLTPVLAPVLAPGTAAAPVAVVPYWSYLIPVGIAFIGMVQVLGLALIQRKIASVTSTVATGIHEAKEAVIVLEKQINSNLDRQIRASVQAAIAQERALVAEELLRQFRKIELEKLEMKGGGGK